ncbi:LCP family protein [Zhenpiania hominis]|uniref:LCP family protein n=1 Tax=Zhenpiania hominis TaxID=2763644 RepID=UPI0039F63508
MASEHSFDHTNASEDLDKAFSGMLEGGGRSAKAKQKKKNKAGGKSKNADSEVAAKEKKKGAKKKKKDPKQTTRKLWVAILSLLIVVIGVGSIIGAGLTVVHTQLDKVTKVQVNRKALGINSRVAKELKNYRNIALLGIDARDMSDDSQTRSDAMIIASINKETNEVKLVSLYRDTYVSLGDNYGLDKMTHAYYYGGATQTLQTINRNLDLNCEEVVVVNWKAVADAVDLLGGLEINIRESEISEMNKYIKDTQKNIGGSKKKIRRAGKQTLNGVQAVTYARIRKDSAEGDHRRNERMKIVLSAAFEKAKNLDLDQLNKIANEVLPSIKTNITTNQMMEILLALNSYKITDSVSWPYDWTDWTYNGIWYGPPVTLKSNVTQLHEEFFNQKNYEPTDTVKEISDRISSLTGRW